MLRQVADNLDIALPFHDVRGSGDEAACGYYEKDERHEWRPSIHLYQISLSSHARGKPNALARDEIRYSNPAYSRSASSSRFLRGQTGRCSSSVLLSRQQGEKDLMLAVWLPSANSPSEAHRPCTPLLTPRGA